MRNASSPQKAQKSQNEFSHLQGSLSLDSQANFSQTVGHPVFLTLLEMPVAKISIQVEGRLPDLITQSPHALVVSHRSALFVFLCLLWPFPAKIPLPHFANASNKSNSGAADRSYSSNSTTSPTLHRWICPVAGKRKFPKGDRSAFREVARRTTPTSPSGRHPRERGRPARMLSLRLPLSFPAMLQPTALPAGTAWARPKQRQGAAAG